MKILAIESSCDETAVAVVEDGRKILTDCIASQVELHRIYGGVVPEIASRKHIEAIFGLADEALSKADIRRNEIDAVAVTDFQLQITLVTGIVVESDRNIVVETMLAETVTAFYSG